MQAPKRRTSHSKKNKRPAHGISTAFWDQVIGRRAARDLDEDHVLRWEDIV